MSDASGSPGSGEELLGGSSSSLHDEEEQGHAQLLDGAPSSSSAGEGAAAIGVDVRLDWFARGAVTLTNCRT